MASTITADNGTVSGSAGLKSSADASGVLTLQSGSGTAALTIDTSQNLQFNSGYGSVATAYGCRAWVSFNGTGTVAISASGNVSSITDNGVGDYTVNFTNAMPDADYSAQYCGQRSAGTISTATTYGFMRVQTKSTSSVNIYTSNTGGTAGVDWPIIDVSIFR